MGRRPGLSINDKNIALGLLEGGTHASDVTRYFCCNEQTIYSLQQRVRQTGSVNDRPLLGRPRITTPREDRYMVTSSRRHCFMLVTKLVHHLRLATGTRISVFRAARLRAQRPYKDVPLTQRHQVAHLDWARRHSRWVRQRWNRVVFTDEYNLTLIPPMIGFAYGVVVVNG
jgi:transposase